MFYDFEVYQGSGLFRGFHPLVCYRIILVLLSFGIYHGSAVRAAVAS